MLQFCWRIVREFVRNIFLKFHISKKLLSAIILVLLTQTSSFSADDVWGEMGLMDDAVKSNTDYANTIFDKYTSYTENQNSNTPDYTQSKYPTDLRSESVG